MNFSNVTEKLFNELKGKMIELFKDLKKNLTEYQVDSSTKSSQGLLYVYVSVFFVFLFLFLIFKFNKRFEKWFEADINTRHALSIKDNHNPTSNILLKATLGLKMYRTHLLIFRLVKWELEIFKPSLANGK